MPAKSAQLRLDTRRLSTSTLLLSITTLSQISDLHISRYVHPEIAPDLEAFGRGVLSALRPSALLLTGDLVDAKTANREGSAQHPEEWEVGLAVARLRRSVWESGADAPLDACSDQEACFAAAAA
jgi:predicted MPP superfamily phosphohydrolase